MTNTDIVKLTGGKRKNGHKMDCTCHICENMKAKAKRNGYTEDIEREKERKNGQQKVNGHKKDCDCPICKNMKNSNGKSVNNSNTSKKAGTKNGKKSNGHKMDCKCPICNNMKKKKGGSDEVELINQGNRDTEEVAEEVADENEYDAIDTVPTKEVKEEVTMTEKSVLPSGGTRKRRHNGKKSNGHKSTCKYPICKNMRNKKGTRKYRRK